MGVNEQWTGFLERAGLVTVGSVVAATVQGIVFALAKEGLDVNRRIFARIIEAKRRVRDIPHIEEELMAVVLLQARQVRLSRPPGWTHPAQDLKSLAANFKRLFL